jgi:hypothetical protein
MIINAYPQPPGSLLYQYIMGIYSSY